MPKKRKDSEEAMYPVVKRHFLKMHCTKVVADLPDESWKAHIPRNDHLRDVDVIAVESQDSTTKSIHVAEGKRLTTGHAFEQCLLQLNSVRGSADFLWAFLPKDQWVRLSEKDIQKNLALVRKEGIGLIVVDTEANRCEVIREATRNQDVDEEDRQLLLGKIGLEGELKFPVVEVLGTVAAEKAMQAISLMCMVEFIFREIIPGAKKKFYLTEYYDNIRDAAEASTKHGAWFATGHWFRDDMCIDFDPFGRYLADGVPVVWICKVATKERLLAEKRPSKWTHWLDEDEWSMVPVGDVASAQTFCDKGG